MATRRGRLLLLIAFLGLCAIFLFLTSASSGMVASRYPLYPESDSSLLDLKHFRYILDSDICRPSPETLFILFLVHSAPTHFEQRNSIRETWGHLSLEFGLSNTVETIFLLGSVTDDSVQRQLEQESQRNGDLVQGNFFDSYRNLTYKHLMGLRWASQRCRHAQFLVKMDDDIFTDVHRLAAALDVRYPVTRKDEDRTRGKIACYIQRKMPVIRDSQSKWYIGSEHNKDHFGDYCSGWAYVLSASSAKELYKSSLHFPYFWVDDVHVTGTLADHARIPRDSMNDCCFAIRTSDLAAWSKSPGKYAWRYLFGPTWGDKELMASAHRKAVWCRRVKCNCCYEYEKMGDVALRDKDTGKPATLSGEAELVVI